MENFLYFLILLKQMKLNIHENKSDSSSHLLVLKFILTHPKPSLIITESVDKGTQIIPTLYAVFFK